MKTIDELCAEIGWTLRGLAERLGANDRTIRRWASGQNPTPPTVTAWLAKLAAYHAKHAAPEGWRTKSAQESEPED